MTCIVAAASAGRVLLGADSMYCEGDYVWVSADPKVWRTGDWLVGAAGHVAWLDLLQHHVRWPRLTQRTSDRAVRVELPAEVRRVAKETGTDLDEAEGSALLGVYGRIYVLDSACVVVRASDGYAAIGSGREPAIGALYASRRQRLTPKHRLRTALEAAERYCASVRRPWRWVG